MPSSASGPIGCVYYDWLFQASDRLNNNELCLMIESMGWAWSIPERFFRRG
jgi:hypothetical protein